MIRLYETETAVFNFEVLSIYKGSFILDYLENVTCVVVSHGVELLLVQR